MSITTRFAPSPTGFLHLGHAHAALFAWRQARAVGGRFLLRIEDIDTTRCKPEFTTAILEDLAWLGLDWDGEMRVQSTHFPDYQAMLGQLAGRGLLYPCFCTRADIAREVAQSTSAPHGPDGAPLYPGTCRPLSADHRAARIAAGARFVLRLDMTQARIATGDLRFEEAGQGHLPCHPEQFGDVVLARKDIPASYHLCVTHDDAAQAVTLVTRGVDLLAATDVHRLLQTLLGWPAPAYAHHRLLTDATGHRLAKRHQAATLRQMRTDGFSPSHVRALAGFAD